MLLAGSRRSRWRFVLLNRHDEPLRELEGVVSADYEVVAQSPLGVSGSLVLADVGADIDFLNDRVQIVYDPGVAGVEAWPTATLLLSSPKDEHVGRRTSWHVAGLSKLSILEGETVSGFAVAAGVNIIDTVVGLIESTGETRVAVTPSDAVLSSPMVFEVGESKLTIVNKLLEAAGYWSLWCDGSGQFRVEPYVRPEQRSPVRVFEAGEFSIVTPSWSREQDLFRVPNRVRVATDGSDEEPPIVGVATNENPDSPFSYQARGRWVDRELERVEASSQAVADSIAAQRLRDAMDPVARYEVSHWIVPLDPHDVVVFAPHGRRVLASVQRMRVACTADALVSATWREVLPL